MNLHKLIIPVVGSFALHSVVLFGFNGTHHHCPTGAPPKPQAAPQYTPITFELEPEKPETSPENSVVTNVALGNPLPGLAEQLRTPEPGNFTFIADITPATVTTESTKSIGIIGMPNGAIDGEAIKGQIGDVVDASKLDNTPEARFQSQPVYPNTARQAGLTGTVDVDFLVGKDGKVQDPKIIRSTNSIFEDAALHAVAKWSFKPGRRLGAVVAFRMRVPIVFGITDE